MQQHRPDHPCPQAAPILPLEAIFDEPDQIPKPTEKISTIQDNWQNPIQERCQKDFAAAKY